MNIDETKTKHKKILVLLFGVVFLSFLFSLTFISAEDFGYNYLEGDLNVAQAINYSQVNVNNSQFLRGLTPTQVSNLFTESDPFWSSNFTLYNSSWSSVINDSYVLKSGDTMTGDLTISKDTAQLTIENTQAGNDPVLMLRRLLGSDSNSAWMYVDDSDGDKFKLVVGDSIAATAAITVTQSGFVGFGIEAPAAPLYAYSNLNGKYAIEADQDHATGYGFRIRVDGTTAIPAFSILQGTTNYLFVVNQDGKVGIGTTSPSAELDVVGSGKFSGDLNITGNYIVGANTGYSGYCVNTTYSGGIAIACND